VCVHVFLLYLHHLTNNILNISYILMQDKFEKYFIKRFHQKLPLILCNLWVQNIFHNEVWEANPIGHRKLCETRFNTVPVSSHIKGSSRPRWKETRRLRGSVVIFAARDIRNFIVCHPLCGFVCRGVSAVAEIKQLMWRLTRFNRRPTRAQFSIIKNHLLYYAYFRRLFCNRSAIIVSEEYNYRSTRQLPVRFVSARRRSRGQRP